MREEDFADLETIAQKFLDSVDTASIEELSRLNTEFHNIIYKRADNIPLLEIITDLHIKALHHPFCCLGQKRKHYSIG